MIRLPAWLAGIVTGLTLVACSADGPNPSSGITLPGETIAIPAATARTRTTPAPVSVPTAASTATAVATAPGATTSEVPVAPGAPTTATSEVILAICDVNVVISDIGPADEGYAFADLRCAEAWGTVVAKAFDQSISTDELIVLRAEDGHWVVEAGGGATTCTSAGIPGELFAQLGCERWERP